MRNSPRFCLWSEERSCRCLPSPWPEPQLSVVLACCCYQATLWCYSHSILTVLPVPRITSPCVIRCPIHDLLSVMGDNALELLSLFSPVWIIKWSGDETGSSHRGNGRTALKMVGCEVLTTIQKQLNVVYYLLLLFLPLLCPPAERELNSKQGGRHNVCCSEVCVCYMSPRARARILPCLLGNKHKVHED